ncbi:MAG TPA: sigma-54 dependent transcriptional regulator [Stellaceae bacterium]|nr:sigma-54 dependent transcriptional regulator [Stellaceae bacterium]
MDDEAELAPRVLVVDDDTDVLTAARLLLRRTASAVEAERRADAALARLADSRFDVVLLDMNLTAGRRDGREGFELLDRVRGLDPAVAIVMMTAFGGVPVAVEAMKRGASDFVLKPWQNEKLIATVLAATSLTRSRRAVERLSVQNEALVAASEPIGDAMLGRAPAMLDLFKLIDRAAPTGVNVLILGESGTGKELVARAIHRRSKRAEQPFVSVDLGAVAETLFEGELFGHKKGAFTDAKTDRPGRMVASSGGTLFLDEIGNLPLYLQRKLLTVLERSEVVPVGGDRPVPIDLRLVSATNVPTAELAKESVFRQDLLYRINTVELTLPPLRDRREDIGLLAEHFIGIYAKKYNMPRRRLSSGALHALEAYRWPGNVRELRHAIERATVLAAGPDFVAGDFPILNTGAAPSASAPNEADTYNLDELERRMIRRALADHSGNISKAAAALGLTRAALYRRMEKHGV